MATRKIKDAKDYASGSLIYFKGHAQATYMSDGRTVEDAINGMKNVDLTGYATEEFVNYKTNELSIIIDEHLATKLELANYYTKQEIDSKGYITSIPSQYITIQYLNGVLESKQDNILDLEIIREGASKGATALQEHQILKTINGQSLIGEGNITIVGGSGDAANLDDYATKDFVNESISEIQDENGYLYSNGEKVDMRFALSLLPTGIEIVENANLNTIDYLKISKYFCLRSSTAKTVTNCPTAMAFVMDVYNPIGTNFDDETTAPYTYRLRKLTEYNTGLQFIQYCNTSGTPGTWTYGDWYLCPQTKFTLNSSKNDGTAVTGSKTQGIYIDADGRFQKTSYTVAKNVPSTAVFTDTKVTTVDNHYTPTENTDSTLSAPEGEVIVGLKRDAAGHVVDVITETPSGEISATLDWENIQNKPDIIQDDYNSNLSIGESEKDYFLISIGNCMKVDPNEKTIDMSYVNTLYVPETIDFKSIDGYEHGYSMSITPDRLTVSGYEDGTHPKTYLDITRLGDGSKFLSDDGTYKEINITSSNTSAYPLIKPDIADNSYTLTPNTFHDFGVVGELTLTLGEEIPGVMNEYLFQVAFIGNCMLSLPANIKWANDDIPDFSDACTYQISIVNNFATYLTFPYHPLH